MKLILVVGWLLFALEALFVLSLAARRNIGDDAAGRGMATGFAILLTPIVVLAGALFAWGQFGGPSLALWCGFGIMATPVVWGMANFSRGMLRKAHRAAGRAAVGRFADAGLTRIARTIDRRDVAGLRAQLAAGQPDFGARDAWGRTLLGHAITRAVDADDPGASTECVRVLLAAGAPPAIDALKAECTPASVTEHDLVYHLLGVGNRGAVAVLDAVLAAGASPHRVDEDGRSILFSTFARMPAVEVLVRRGADVRALDTRSDRQGWSLLMNAVLLENWDQALHYLERGVPKDHVAPDGTSVATMLADRPAPADADDSARAAAERRFRAALAR